VLASARLECSHWESGAGSGDPEAEGVRIRSAGAPQHPQNPDGAAPCRL